MHGDAGSEAFLSEIVGAASWPGLRHMNMESIYEYGARAGFWRLHRLFTSRAIKPTVYGVATALERSPEQLAAMLEADWEMGLPWLEVGLSTKTFHLSMSGFHMNEAIALHTRLTGERPLGWYTGRSSVNTLDLAAQEGGFLYLSDSYADDLPYWNGQAIDHSIYA